MKKNSEKIDYISFVPDGEPALDINLGKEIDALKKLSGIKVAVITNASLLWKEDVRQDLSRADLVSIKVDTAGSKDVWRRINNPHPDLDFDIVLEGIRKFASVFKGRLLTETLLVRDLNDTEPEVRKTAEFLSGIRPAVAFIGIATRPPAEKWVLPPDEEKINRAYQIFSESGLPVELMTGGGGGGEFGFTGNVENDILNIVSVHPMSRQQVEDLLKKAGGSWEMIKLMLGEKKIKEIDYRGEKYYLKNFSK